MEKSNLKLLQMSKRGAVDGAVDKVIGLVVVIAIIAGCASQLFNFNLTTSGAPAWVNSTLVVFVGIGVVYLVWNIIKGKK